MLAGAAVGMGVALLVEAVRPRGGTIDLLDWEEVGRLASERLKGEPLGARRRATLAAGYNKLAAELTPPLLDALGGLPDGAALPRFQALDRQAWLEVNVTLLRRAFDPVEQILTVPDSRLAQLGRAGLDRYVAVVLTFLSGKVLGQFDPQLLGREPVEPGLYLVEPNVADWEKAEDLPGQDLRRWLILHELAHAWQFAAHPWLREHLNSELTRALEAAASATAGSPLERLRSLTTGVPEQWQAVRRMQSLMTLVEGHGNLVMNVVGRDRLPSFEQLESAHDRRSSRRSPLEVLFFRLTGLEMKLEQYRVGEAFCRAVYDRYGMDALNRAWESPETLPSTSELRDPEAWYQRVVSPAALPRRSPH